MAIRPTDSAAALTREAFDKLSPEERYKLFAAGQKLLADKEQLIQAQELAIAVQKEAIAEQTQTIVYMQSIINEAREIRLEMYAALQKHVPPAWPEDGCAKSMQPQLEWLIADYIDWMQRARSWFKNTPFGNKGKDLPDKKGNKEENTPAKPGVEASLKNNNSRLKNLKKKLLQALEALPEGLVPDSVIEDMRELAGNNYQRKLKNKAPGKGRKAKKRFNAKTKKRKATHEQDNKCSRCGKTNLVNIKDMIQNIMEDTQKVRDALEACTNIHEILVCNDCGKVSIAIDKNQDLPHVPGRQVTLVTLVRAGSAMYRGIPLNNFAKSIRVDYELGGDTLSYSFHDFCRIYILPLVQQTIIPYMQQCAVLVADETQIDCLQVQGRGNLSKEQKAAGVKPVTTANRILAVSTPTTAEHKFALYRFMKSRSGENISRQFEGCNFHTLITDGYQCYSSLVKERQCKNQVCLVHMRRYFIQAACPAEYAEMLEKKTDEEQIEFLRESILKGKPVCKMLTLIEGIGDIYALENSVDTSVPGFEEKLLKVRQKSAEIMQRMDNVVQSMIPGRVEQQANGKWKVVIKDSHSEAIVYWMNNRDKLRVFLTDPYVTPDSNIVENAIRPMVTYRRNISGWKQNADYIEDSCAVYSLFETLRRNGRVKNPEQFVLDFCRALWKHCVEKAYEEALKDGKDPNTQLKHIDMLKMSEGFDFQAWNPIFAHD